MLTGLDCCPQAETLGPGLELVLAALLGCCVNTDAHPLRMGWGDATAAGGTPAGGFARMSPSFPNDEVEDGGTLAERGGMGTRESMRRMSSMLEQRWG